ncbi:MAG: protein kinase [Polyangiaceae bacterium]|jgi:hypothetical protein|nr:protein kinase [Polyangiaceae bacterium]
MTPDRDEQEGGPASPADAGLEGVLDRLRQARPGGEANLARRLAKSLLVQRIKGEVGPTLGRYELRERVGSGGMGSVFRAWDPMLERDIAIKVLATQGPAEASQAMLAEARVLARLTHPHVLTVHDMGIQDGQLWMAMELITEGNLRQWVARRRPDWRVLVRRFAEAARGLAAAHAAGIVHRDVKPENLLVGGDGRTRVADFGLAVRSGSSDARAAGTPVYLPPEARRGAVPDARWDQYSVCLSLQEMLALLAAGGAVRVPGRLVSALERGIASAPGDRWPSMDTLADTLDALAARPAPDARRRMLLDRVEGMWIDGVLDASLAHRRLLEVRVVSEPGAVESPWGGQGAGAPRVSSILGIAQAFEAAQRGVLLLGSAGAGKTTAMLLAARDMLRDAHDDAAAPIPVILNLSSFSPEASSLEAWLAEELGTKYGLARGYAVGLLAEGHRLALLLDGLDEVRAERRAACVEAINAFRRESGVGLMVACRDEVYHSTRRRLALGLALQLEPLEGRLPFFFEEGPRPVQGERLLRTPLMQALAQDTHLSAGTDAKALFQAYVERALDRRPVLGPKERGALLEQITWLARAMQRVGASDVWLERLQADWLPRRGQRAAARLLGLLLIAGVLLGGNTAVAAALGRPLVMGPLFGGPMLLPVLWFSGGLSVRPRQELRWSAGAALRRGFILTACSTLAGALFGLKFRVGPSLIMGLVGGVVSSVMTGFVPGDADAATRPGEGLRQSARNAVRLAVPAGTFVGAFMGLVVVPLLKAHPELGMLLRTLPDIERNLTVQIGTTSILTGLLIYGGAAVLLHAALRVVLAACTPLPLRLVPLLDAAADRGLLRRVGGGWMFQHKLLLDHLASRGASEASPLTR